MFSETERHFRAAAPAAEFCSLRVVSERAERLLVRSGTVQPVEVRRDLGAMITVADRGGVGYAATADLSLAGLRRAIGQAREWARQTAPHGLVTLGDLPRPVHEGEYRSPVAHPWAALPPDAKLDLLTGADAALAGDARIVDRRAGITWLEQETLLLTSDGARILQHVEYLLPTLCATAYHQGESQTRTLGGGVGLHQGGLEVLDWIGFADAGARIAEQALQLLSAPNCPAGCVDLVLAPDQMVLQIHESIGHPLELDRILGDERNYAGTSFVTPEMFGSYRYGSALLNVTFDPGVAGELSSYGYDDDGTAAERHYLIRDGILQRPLGSALSQARAGLPGVANARACAWNRPPIDRMANLNLEPGSSSPAELIGQVERGIYMESNRSWSIDDARNKFQFGCEWGQLIEDGELKGVVRNPNYRGISATFWRSLAGVGNRDAFRVMGVSNCGKGEPNQAIRVGHASPPCLFRQVDVFGGG